MTDYTPMARYFRVVDEDGNEVAMFALKHGEIADAVAAETRRDGYAAFSLHTNDGLSVQHPGCRVVETSEHMYFDRLRAAQPSAWDFVVGGVE
jgi:hypothetical protein